MNDNTSKELAQYLGDARAHAEAGNYTEALACLSDARNADPDNIYVLAFEKQIEQLHDLSSSHTLKDDQKTDVLESIPHIIERALTSGGTPGAPGRAGDAQPAASPAAAGGTDERMAALEWLKNQYFQHAHEYVQRGEYQHALTEIRRVYIIDPDNVTASEFERQIQGLAEMKEAEEGSWVPGEPALEGVPEQENAALPGGDAESRTTPEGSSTPDEDSAVPRITGPEPVLVDEEPPADSPVTEEPVAAGSHRRDQKAPRRRQKRDLHAAHAKQKKGFSTFAMIIIFGGLVLIGGGIFFLATRPAARHLPIRQSPTVIAPTPTTYSEESTARIQTFILSERRNADGTQNVEVTLDTALVEEPAGPESETHPPAAATSGRSTAPSQREGISSSARRETRRPAQRTPEPAPLTAETQTPSPPERSGTAQSETTPVEIEPKIARLETPRLQEVVFAEGLEGQVVIQVLIDASGRPLETRILRSTNERLNGPVIDAVMRSSFSPARMPAGPVAAWLTIPFTLRKATR